MEANRDEKGNTITLVVGFPGIFSWKKLVNSPLKSSLIISSADYRSQEKNVNTPPTHTGPSRYPGTPASRFSPMSFQLNLESTSSIRHSQLDWESGYSRIALFRADYLSNQAMSYNQSISSIFF
jgi:hypothetical protein